MDDKVFQAALAGLLHDVGKFAQRAAEGLKIPWSDDENSDIKKRYRRQHALYTDQIVEQIVPDKWRQEVRAAAGHHHNPQTHLERVVALADYLSAGERADERKDHPKQLQSIFCGITGLKDRQPPTAKYLPLKKLEIKQDIIFPVDRIDDSYGTYEALWRDFDRDAQSLKSTHTGDKADPLAYLHSLLDLMQRYTWCVPSAYYRSVPDVSLYDHSRMTAALAACLVGQPEDKVQAWLEKKNQDESVALLVGGDISGVQRFIYTLTSAGAAKSLRGRSFYLQLLTEAIAHYALDRLGLPITNLIYAGGGNFFLLAPLEQQGTLKQIAEDITLKLLDTHEGELNLILAGTEIKANQFKVNKFYKVWDSLRETLNQKKLQPLANLKDDKKLTEQLGVGMGEGGDEEHLCAICGREDTETKPKDSGGDEVRTCRLCESFETLGNDLVKATHLVTSYSAPREHKQINKWHHGLELFGMNFWPVNADKLPKQGQQYLRGLPSNPQLIDIAAVGDEPAKCERALQGELAQCNAPQLQTLRLFARLVPQDKEGYPLTFDELAELAAKTENNHRWSGLKRWGVLRMDVDNLGMLFTEGFKATIKEAGQDKEINTLTLSRLASLSFALRLFFEGWLPQLGQPDKPELSEAEKRMRNRLYMQYSGGDDLFVVGSWDALPEFALAIRDSFGEYVGHNPAVTLSGGISLAAIKYPLYQAAEDADEAEGQAKKYRRSDKREKDALSFLGQGVGWEEFGKVKDLAYELEDWCGGEEARMPHALIQNLLAIYTEYRDERDEALKQGRWKPHYDSFYGPWRWHLAYMFGRRINDRKTPEDIKARLAEIEKDMLYSKKIETIGLAARWAQYLIRK